MSLGPVIDDAVRTVTKDDFFFLLTYSERQRKGFGFFLLSLSLHNSAWAAARW